MKHLIDNNEIVRSEFRIPSKFKRPNGEVFWGGYDKRTDLHYEDGWRDEERPEINPKLQELNNPHFDENIDKVTWDITQKELPSLETLQENHLLQLDVVSDEISSLYDKLKNRFDPLGETPGNMPLELRTLINMGPGLMDRGTSEIEALETVQDAMNYVIRGPEITGYINSLVAFL